jgi:hypothetical protein
MLTCPQAQGKTEDDDEAQLTDNGASKTGSEADEEDDKGKGTGTDVDGGDGGSVAAISGSDEEEVAHPKGGS